jgi:hypothetical protein
MVAYTVLFFLFFLLTSSQNATGWMENHEESFQEAYPYRADTPMNASPSVGIIAWNLVAPQKRRQVATGLETNIATGTLQNGCFRRFLSYPTQPSTYWMSREARENSRRVSVSVIDFQ